MAQVYPFRAFRYNPKQAPFDRVLTQPYDKISPAMQEKYYAADPHNLIAVEKGRAYPSDTPKNDERGAASSEREHSRNIPRASFSGTSTHFPDRRRTSWSFCDTRKRTPGSFSCCIRTRRNALTRFSRMRKRLQRR